MNYDRILSAILMDAKLAMIAASLFLAVGILIAVSILAENILRNLRDRLRAQREMTVHAGNRSKALKFNSPPHPTAAGLNSPILHA